MIVHPFQASEKAWSIDDLLGFEVLAILNRVIRCRCYLPRRSAGDDAGIGRY